MGEIAGVIIIYGEDISRFLAEMSLEGEDIAYPIMHLVGIREALEHLKKTYPKQGVPNKSPVLVILENSLKSLDFFEDLENCPEVDRSRLCFVALTLTLAQNSIRGQQLRKYPICSIFEERVSKELIEQAIISCTSCLVHMHSEF